MFVPVLSAMIRTEQWAIDWLFPSHDDIAENEQQLASIRLLVEL
jgi:hypothetical protein